MPVLVAALLSGKLCEGAQVCWYLDNDAARSAFIKAYGATRFADGMVSAFTKHEAELQLKSWFARVPSVSNISDAPSRHEDSTLRDHGALKVPINWATVKELLQSELLEMGEVAADSRDRSPIAG